MVYLIIPKVLHTDIHTDIHTDPPTKWVLEELSLLKTLLRPGEGGLTLSGKVPLFLDVAP